MRTHAMSGRGDVWPYNIHAHQTVDRHISQSKAMLASDIPVLAAGFENAS